MATKNQHTDPEKLHNFMERLGVPHDPRPASEILKRLKAKNARLKQRRRRLQSNQSN